MDSLTLTTIGAGIAWLINFWYFFQIAAMRKELYSQIEINKALIIAIEKQCDRDCSQTIFKKVERMLESPVTREM